MFFFPPQIAGFPQPSLEIHPSEALANQLVTVLCNSSAPEPLSFSLQIQNASGGILASSDEFPLQFNLTAQEEDNEQEFVCAVELEIDGKTMTKHTSATLTVFCEYRISFLPTTGCLLVFH